MDKASTRSGRPTRELKQSHTYAILDVAPATMADIKQRLEEAEVLEFYQDQDDAERELIVFGTTALRVDTEA